MNLEKLTVYLVSGFSAAVSLAVNLFVVLPLEAITICGIWNTFLIKLVGYEHMVTFWPAAGISLLVNFVRPTTLTTPIYDSSKTVWQQLSPLIYRYMGIWFLIGIGTVLA